MVTVTTLSFHQQFFHKSCVTISYNKIVNQRISIIPYMKGYCSYHYFNHSKSFFSSRILGHSLLQRKIDYARLVLTTSTFILYGYQRSSAAQRSSALWRVTASGLRWRSRYWPLQRLMYQCVNMYTNQMSMSLDYPGQDPLPN